MTTRKDSLERLQIASPCPSPWEAMPGDGRRRHCAQCDRQVYDFAQLTPREIAGVVEASGGHLCARLTRDGAGRLVVREPSLAAPPPVLRRVSPLAAAVVAAMVGLSGGPGGGSGGVAGAEQAVAVSSPADLAAAEEPEGDRPQQAGPAGGSLGGRLATEGGEPIPDAEVKLRGQLDGRERAGRTDAEGRFSFASLMPGVYELAASARGQHAASQGDILLRAGEAREVGLSVPSGVWQRIVAGTPPSFALGGAIAMTEEPMRRAYAAARLVVLGVAGKSAVVKKGEYTWEVRTEVALSAVFKGETGERVISVFHDQMAGEAAASGVAPGDRVLAFLAPRQAEDGRAADGYAAADPWRGLRKLSAAEAESYGRRLAALARRGALRPEEILEWLVATAEDPVTRGGAMGELRDAVQRLDRQAGQHGAPAARYTQELRQVLADFRAAGGELAGEAEPAIVAAYLTGAERERLTAALLRTPRLTATDLDLYELVSPWHEDRLLPWLIGRLEAAELTDWPARRMMKTIAEGLDDEVLSDFLTTGEERIGKLEEKLQDAASDAAQRRLGAKLDAAEEGLRRRFVEALRQRRR